MQKLKQILSLIGVILLVLMYVLALLAGIFDPTESMSYLAAALAATIIIPFFLWAINFILSGIKSRQDDLSSLSSEDEDDNSSKD